MTKRIARNRCYCIIKLVFIIYISINLKYFFVIYTIYFSKIDNNYYICRMKNSKKQKTKSVRFDKYETVSRAEYREILLARMAGGDLYAMEAYQKIKEADVLLDVFREKPIYNK